MIVEPAPAKVNLLLHVGPRRSDGLHELCSIFASVDLADELRIEPSEGPNDTVVCAAVPGLNLAARALDELRRALDGRAELPPLTVEIEKRIPIAGGLGGGSADAAAVLRVANRLAGSPLDASGLRRVAARVGADVPSQVEPGHALVAGAGEVVEPLELPPMRLVLAPSADGLSTAAVYAEADRLGSTRPRVDPAAVRRLAAAPLERLAPTLENDLEPAALSLRPELATTLTGLRGSGALAALVTGSGPTVFAVFQDRADAERAARLSSSSVLASLRNA